MKFVIRIFPLQFLLLVLTLFLSVISSQSFFYEKMKNYGLGNRYLRSNDRQGYPDPLPSPPRSVISMIRTPYETLYQGVKGIHDKKVYSRQFNYNPKSEGQHVFCKGDFDCILTHLSIETEGGIPVILRGGAGYEYFDVVVRARPASRLAGSVRAYCRNGTSERFLRH